MKVGVGSESLCVSGPHSRFCLNIEDFAPPSSPILGCPTHSSRGQDKAIYPGNDESFGSVQLCLMPQPSLSTSDARPTQDNADCQNNVGSFTCTCNTGYEGVGVCYTQVNDCSSASTSGPNGEVEDGLWLLDFENDNFNFLIALTDQTSGAVNAPSQGCPKRVPPLN